MGRRKSKRKPPPKRKAIEPLDLQFNCPFCNHEKSCEVKMDKGRNTAKITCRVCLEDYQATINFLSEPVDVYNDWIDACESANWIFCTIACCDTICCNTTFVSVKIIKFCTDLNCIGRFWINACIECIVRSVQCLLCIQYLLTVESESYHVWN